VTSVEERVIDIVCENLGVNKEQVARQTAFVEDMGDKMDYRVALDAVPEGKDAQDGAMSKNWMGAADQNGIPTAFIVNGDGVIAWIGHPMRMDKPLADSSTGLPPAVGIDQTQKVRSARSTVGTMTEVNDYLKVLFARAGTLHCANCATPVERRTPSAVASESERIAALSCPAKYMSAIHPIAMQASASQTCAGFSDD